MDSEQLELKDLNHVDGVPDYNTTPDGAEHHRVAASTAGKLRVAAVVVSWLSVIFSFSTGVAAIVLGCVKNSESLFGYGLDATLDSFSSVAVLWRFYGDETDLYSEKKERRACLVIGILFIISGLMLTLKSVISIATKVHESTAVVLYTAFACTTGVVAVVLALIKVYLGYKLESAAMATDSIITFVGAAMSFAGVAGLELYVKDTHLWFMDSVFGIVCGLFLVVFGIKVVYDTVYKHKNGHDQLL